MKNEEEREPETKERQAETVAEEMESEMEGRQRRRRDQEQAEQEDLNQGMQTGTHHTTRFGVNWGPSYTIRPEASKSEKDSKDKK